MYVSVYLFRSVSIAVYNLLCFAPEMFCGFSIFLFLAWCLHSSPPPFCALSHSQSHVTPVLNLGSMVKACEPIVVIWDFDGMQIYPIAAFSAWNFKSAGYIWYTQYECKKRELSKSKLGDKNEHTSEDKKKKKETRNTKSCICKVMCK